MVFRLSPSAASAGYGLAAFDTIGSTSTEASARVRTAEAGPLWIVARQQTEGRGRRGSAWATPDGNLAASLLLTTDAPPHLVATLGFVAGLALGDALAACCGASRGVGIALDEARNGRDRFALKWPNDVLADGGKLAGILLGTETAGDGRRAVIIGIGVNVAEAPANLPYPSASLNALGFDTSAAELFTALSSAWVRVYDLWRDGNGFGDVRRLWLERAAGLGGEVAVRTAAGVTRGIFETIDDHGQLVIRIADGSARLVTAGEVHFGAAASATPEARA